MGYDPNKGAMCQPATWCEKAAEKMGGKPGARKSALTWDTYFFAKRRVRPGV